jgi:ParB family transcriptional regulator, chromosome partitioning protein
MSDNNQKTSTGDSSNRRLGRGLAALIGDIREETGEADAILRDGARKVPTALIKANPRNPRKDFNDDELADLARSIEQRGVVQPIIVRPSPDTPDEFEIVAGERRWRAAQRAGLHEVPVVVRELADREAMEIALVENIQRTDLNALEEALGYDQLMTEFQYTQAELGEAIGKSRSHVANMLRLLKLPDPVRDMLSAGELTAGHAKILVGHDDPTALARTIVGDGLNVRQAEALARRANNPAPARRPARVADTGALDADTRALEETLRTALGYDVKIRHGADGKGEIIVAYKNLEQLDHVCRRLQGFREN